MIPAGDFLSWLGHIRQAQVSHEGMEVPCGDCRACCTSSYFIHIKPSESETLSKIPQNLLFAAPGLPKGHVLLGYDKRGHCPLFVDNKCSIYQHRPQTCRDYDCRIFPATGLAESDDRPLITEQSNRWRFDCSTDQDYVHFGAVKGAARFLKEYSKFFPEGFIPRNPTQLAMLAIKVYEVFLTEGNESIKSKDDIQIHEIPRAVIAAYEQFEQRDNAQQLPQPDRPVEDLS